MVVLTWFTGEYENNFMQIRFESDDNSPLIKTIVAKSVFQEGKKILSTSFFRWMFVLIINVKIWWIDISKRIDINKANA